MAGFFGPALIGLPDGGVFGPVVFQDYRAKHNLPPKTTASAISIDAYEKLSPELRDADAMVLRLGPIAGTGRTAFAIVRVKGQLREFFLFNDDVFSTNAADTFLPSTSWRHLYSFKLLNRFSESALLNLAFASGLLSSALELDDESALPAPASGHSTFTFRFRAHPAVKEQFNHHAGQVEVDAIFVARRNGREELFIVEAKIGEKTKSLAKHKLVYPVLAVANLAPAGMRVVPVYLHMTHEDDGLHYQIVECDFPNPRGELPAITDLVATSKTHLVLPLK